MRACHFGSSSMEALLVAELHKIPLLSRSHKVHHSSERLDGWRQRAFTRSKAFGPS